MTVMDQHSTESDEAGTARQARFGKLPPRIRPESIVESVDTATPQERPGPSGTEAQRQTLLAGG
ncbi:hypothetical protein [Paractinoplanes lichenicola]|uniref:Uncharacterized protein n=1 Tax=Paractinoplanes lichenicola TaxID=2802976 RepID=A0ABS1VZU7_9ACTN|nr:hypothetical protein [Actinoplanes lichenicola]MBL7260015.1 hypothetical protein [Actinoplanes lichenicola]